MVTELEQTHIRIGAEKRIAKRAVQQRWSLTELWFHLIKELGVGEDRAKVAFRSILNYAADFIFEDEETA